MPSTSVPPQDETTASEIVREALRRYLESQLTGSRERLIGRRRRGTRRRRRWRAGRGTPGRGRSASWFGVGVAGGFLDVAQRDAGVEGGGDERMAERVGPDRLVDAGSAGEAAHDPPGGVAVEPIAVWPRKIGPSTRSPMARSIARAVRGASGMVDDLAALAQHGEGAMTALDAERLDVGAERFGRRAAR